MTGQLVLLTPALCVFQMDISMLADHIVETSAVRLKQEVVEPETESEKAWMNSNVRLLSGYLTEVER